MLGEQARERQDHWTSMLKKKNIITNDIFTRGPVFIVYFSRSSNSFFKYRIAHRFFISESFLLQVRKKIKKLYGLDS